MAGPGDVTVPDRRPSHPVRRWEENPWVQTWYSTVSAYVAPIAVDETEQKARTSDGTKRHHRGRSIWITTMLGDFSVRVCSLARSLERYLLRAKCATGQL
jgi:hypothetical protein